MTKGIELRVCTGSDLTANLFAAVIRPNDPIVLIGASPRQAQQLRARYGLQRLEHFDPAMGFINDPDAVETCLRFIEARSPFRFCVLAVGSPQQEMLARQLKARGVARGLALCVGASINFLTGDERRAPRWMQRCGAEWAYRLMQSPGRMAQRYLVRGPRVFGLLRRARIVVRPTAPPVLQIVQSHVPVTVAQWPKAPRDNDDTLRRISVTN
jgi:exopolysaccharide biosynthesis WecB/TagA/CpsF family protein